MKTKLLLSVLALGLFLSAFSQKPTIELTFTAENSGQYVPLDSTFIENLTQGGDTTLYAPDTVLVFDYVTSISNKETIDEYTFSVSQNYPNPFKGKTEVNLYLPERDDIKITVRDILGRELAHYENTLNIGIHSISFYAGNEKYYLLTVTGKQTSQTIKMLNADSHKTNGEQCKIVYTGNNGNVIGFKSQQAINSFGFSIGDELRYTGYAMTTNEVNGSDVIEDTPQSNEIYEFNITEGISCPEIPTLTYEGQVYNTVLIGNKCWLKENLNVGTMINGNEEMTDNDTIEKYCYDNDPTNCVTYGGLYQWNEMMQYIITSGIQGVCPLGWHIPTDEEWKQLEGFADSQYGYPDPEWDISGYRGFDAGLNLKSTSNWNSYGNGTNLYGFTVVPSGYRYSNSNFISLGHFGYFWSSTENLSNNPIHRMFRFDADGINRYGTDKYYGFSIRCLKD